MQTPSYISVVCVVVAMLATGCLMPGKRGDAVDAANIRDSARSLTRPGSSLKAFARVLEESSNLTRSSGQVTLLRLKALFPNLRDHVIGGGDYTELGTGLNRSLLQPDRPVSAVSQLALRMAIIDHCKDTSGYNRVFIMTTALAREEKAPVDNAVALAFAAARNVWLYPYTEDSAEVQAARDTTQRGRLRSEIPSSTPPNITVTAHPISARFTPHAKPASTP